MITDYSKNTSKLCSTAKSKYYCGKINECRGDQRKLYNIMNSLLYRKKSNALPTHNLPNMLANQFSHLFSDKIKTIRQALNLGTKEKGKDVNTKTHIGRLRTLSNLQPATMKNIQEVIQKGNSKSCHLDPIPTVLLKKILPELLPTIHHIVNASLSTMTMPDQLKIATVTPIIKKSNADPEDFKSFRPVSNLPYLGKVIEKLVINQIDQHLEDNDLVEPMQSAYRKNHSTETALLKIHNDILLSLDRKRCVYLVLLDLSAAFDTIDHDIFLKRMEIENGIIGEPKQWLISYFTNRQQAVVINGTTSDNIKLNTGFPQGSYIGPSGFKSYTRPLSSIAKKHGIDIHLYADDTQLYTDFEADQADQTLERLEGCIEEIKRWMAMNFLKLNDSKTEFMILGSAHHLSKIGSKSLQIGTEVISPSKSARNIGAVLDQSMTMDEQVKSVCNSCYSQLRQIHHIRRCLTREATETLIHSFISSRLDNLNALLYGIPNSMILRLQYVQNCAARIVLQLKKFDHITAALKELHWLPIESRITYKILMLTHKAIHGKSPKYICELIKLRNSHRTPRSAHEYKLDNRLFLPRSHKYGDRAFIVSAPRLWNNLPTEIRKLGFTNKNTDSFKRNLKTHLYQCAFQES